jgi:hypothetical protein
MQQAEVLTPNSGKLRHARVQKSSHLKAILSTAAAQLLRSVALKRGTHAREALEILPPLDRRVALADLDLEHRHALDKGREAREARAAAAADADAQQVAAGLQRTRSSCQYRQSTKSRFKAAPTRPIYLC